MAPIPGGVGSTPAQIERAQVCYLYTPHPEPETRIPRIPARGRKLTSTESKGWLPMNCRTDISSIYDSHTCRFNSEDSLPKKGLRKEDLARIMSA